MASLSPEIRKLLELNPNNKTIQQLALQDYLSSSEQAKKTQMINSLLGGSSGSGLSGPQVIGTRMFDSTTGTWVPIQQQTQQTVPQETAQKTGGGVLGLLGGIGKAAVSPIVGGLKWIGESVPYLGHMAAGGLKGEELWKTGESYKPWLYSEKEWEKIKNDPKAALGEGIKAGAGFASYIPAGSAVSVLGKSVPVAMPAIGAGSKLAQSALGRTALAGVRAAPQGALYGISETKAPLGSKKSLQDIQNATIGAGVGGAAFQGLGEAWSGAKGLVKGLGAKGKSVVEKGVDAQAAAKGIQTPQTPEGFKQRGKIFKEARDVISANGESYNKRGISNTFGKLKNIYNSLLKSSNAVADRNQIVNEAVSQASLYYDIPEDKARKIIESAMARYGGDDVAVTAKSLAAIKKGVQSQSQVLINSMSPSRKAIAEGTLHDIVDASLKNDILPEAAPILKQMSSLHAVAPDIIKSSDKGGYFTSAFVGNVRVPIPVQGAISTVQGAYGRGLEKAGNVLGNIGEKTSGLQIGTPKISSGLGQTAIALGGGGLGMGIPGVESAPQEQQSLLSEYSPGVNANVGQVPALGGQPSGLGGNLSPQQLIGLYMADPELAKFIMDMQSQSSGRSLPLGTVGDITEGRSAIADMSGLLSDVESVKDIASPVIGGIMQFAPGSKQQQLRAKLDRIKQSVGKMLESGVLRKEDEEKYKRILPKITDADATVQSKIEELDRTLKRDLAIYLDNLQRSGYDISGYQDIIDAGQQYIY